MYDLNALQQETTCNDENSYKMNNNWSNIQQNGKILIIY